MGKRRAADARGRRQPGERRDLCVGSARTASRRVRLRLARPADRPAHGRRHLGRPRHPDRRPAGLVLPRTSRGLGSRPDGRRLGPGSRGICCPSSAAYGEAVFAHHLSTRGTLCRTSRGRDVACPQRVRRAGLRMPLRAVTSRVPGVAARHLRRPRKPEHRLGDGILGPDLRRHRRCRRTRGGDRSVANPAQQLDYHRFSDAELRRCYRRERDIIATHTDRAGDYELHGQPAARRPTCGRWRDEVDVVANDHYLTAERADRHIRLAMAADMSRSVGRRHSRGSSWSTRPRR